MNRSPRRRVAVIGEISVKVGVGHEKPNENMKIARDQGQSPDEPDLPILLVVDVPHEFVVNGREMRAVCWVAIDAQILARAADVLQHPTTTAVAEFPLYHKVPMNSGEREDCFSRTHERTCWFSPLWHSYPMTKGESPGMLRAEIKIIGRRGSLDLSSAPDRSRQRSVVLPLMSIYFPPLVMVMVMGLLELDNRWRSLGRPFIFDGYR
jgi:hypothetical protein